MDQGLRLGYSNPKKPGRALLQVQACWGDHCQQMLTLRSIFLYLDRTHAISTAGVKSLFEMGLQLFRKHLAEHPEVWLGFFLSILVCRLQPFICHVVAGVPAPELSHRV